MIALVLALTAAGGMTVLVSPWISAGARRAPSTADPSAGRTGVRTPPPSAGAARSAHVRRRTADWLAQAGLSDMRPRDLAGAVAAVALVAFVVGLALFGGVVVASCIGVAAAVASVLRLRSRRRSRRRLAADAWPRLIEELRVQTGSLGRSVPQALFEIGRRAPDELRPAFERAHREWMLTTDFARSAAVLRRDLADPTADTVLETLLVAHELGGSGLDRHLEDLAEDRRREVESRKDARAKQSGARFSRWFVLIVPAGMALVGLQIGDGRASYASSGGQVAVLFALALISVCWWWAERMMRLPEDVRVFRDGRDGEKPLLSEPVEVAAAVRPGSAGGADR